MSEIRNEDYLKQFKDFEGLKWGTIRPTDIDMVVDFHNKLLIWVELKYGETEIPPGQRLALERICDAIEKAGLKSYVLIAKHNSQDRIIVAEAIVVEYRASQTWQKPENPITISEAISKLRTIHGIW